MHTENERQSDHGKKKWTFFLVWGLLTILLVSSSGQGQMRVEREVSPEDKPFVLKGLLSPAFPGAGEVVEITAEVASRVAPHIRTVVRFWVDGKKREETSYVISPFAESIVTHEWQAAKGRHTIMIELLSPAGILYEFWEKEVAIK